MQFFLSILAIILPGLVDPVHVHVKSSCNSALGAHSQAYRPSLAKVPQLFWPGKTHFALSRENMPFIH